MVRILDFAPGEITQSVMISILDDIGHPELEGVETFDLYLHLPVGGSVGAPSIARVLINDSVSDCKFYGVYAMAACVINACKCWCIRV